MPRLAPRFPALFRGALSLTVSRVEELQGVSGMSRSEPSRPMPHGPAPWGELRGRARSLPGRPRRSPWGHGQAPAVAGARAHVTQVPAKTQVALGGQGGAGGGRGAWGTVGRAGEGSRGRWGVRGRGAAAAGCVGGRGGQGARLPQADVSDCTLRDYVL